jgi:hypothetical protein
LAALSLNPLEIQSSIICDVDIPQVKMCSITDYDKKLRKTEHKIPKYSVPRTVNEMLC